MDIKTYFPSGISLYFILPVIAILASSIILTVYYNNPLNQSTAHTNASNYAGIHYEDGSRHMNIYSPSEERSWKPENITEVIREVRNNNKGQAIVETNIYPSSRPSKEELGRSWNLYNSSFESAKRNNWFNKEEAFTDGYFNWDQNIGHYPHKNYTNDNETLNPQKPEYLMFYEAPNRDSKMLVGVMYRKTRVWQTGEQVGGPITRWHYHIYPEPQCLFDRGREPLREISGSECPEGVKISPLSREMIHVWFIDHPQGQFSHGMGLPKKALKEGPRKLSKTEFINKQNKSY